MYAILHAFCTPPFFFFACNTQWKCIGDFTHTPLPLGAYIINGRPLCIDLKIYTVIKQLLMVFVDTGTEINFNFLSSLFAPLIY